MDAFYDNLGRRTRDYGNFAEMVLKFNMSRWTGNPVEAMSLQPDLDQVDLRVKLPTFMKGRLDLVPNEMVLNWQIKHTVTRPRSTELVINRRSVPAMRVGVSSKTVQRLRQRARTAREPFLLAYGIAKQSPGSASPLDEDPYEAFDWYAIDLTQYFRHVGDDCDNIRIPVDNRLNLLSFSLLWASHWVRDFYEPLTRYRTGDQEGIDALVRTIYPNPSALSSPAAVEVMRHELEARLPHLLRTLQAPESEKRQISTALGLGATLEDIRAKVRSASAVQDISTYCPESLYGTASLWLFSRSYWHFMKESAAAVKPEQRRMNRRWLPVRLELNDTPRLLWAVLYCVVKLYERLGVNVSVVRPFHDHDIGADRSVYGGNIGHLPYISLSNDGLHWTRETISRGDESSHRDFFAQASHHVIVGQNEPLTNVPALSELPRSQLEMSGRPHLLFAEEDGFLKHPSPLWNRIVA